MQPADRLNVEPTPRHVLRGTTARYHGDFHEYASGDLYKEAPPVLSGPHPAPKHLIKITSSSLASKQLTAFIMLSQLLAFLPLAATVLALPASSANPSVELAARDGEYIYWKYYGDGGCHGDWIDDSALGQSGNIGMRSFIRGFTLPALLSLMYP